MASEFIPVASAGDIAPGAVVAFKVGGAKVAVANVDGALHAFDDCCTHKRCSLAEGDLEGCVIICPCHRSKFDVATGAVLAPPATAPVAAYEVRVVEGRIQVRV